MVFSVVVAVAADVNKVELAGTVVASDLQTMTENPENTNIKLCLCFPLQKPLDSRSRG